VLGLLPSDAGLRLGVDGRKVAARAMVAPLSLSSKAKVSFPDAADMGPGAFP
jgi:hypothetical protein